MAGRSVHITVGDIEELQALLRRPSAPDRSEAVSRLRGMQGLVLDRQVARAALRAAAVAYPWVPGVPEDTSELLVQLLWSAPAVVEVTELERAYLWCAERGRRAVLRAMALRADRVGLAAVEHLIDQALDESAPAAPVSIDGPATLPAPSRGLLSPLLGVEGVARLAPKLVSLVLRRGWSEHATEMVSEMCRLGVIDAATSKEVTGILLPVIHDLADTCDRMAVPRHAGLRRRGDATVVDPARMDRSRLVVLLALLGHLPCEGAVVGLRRALACVDPRVSAAAAASLVGRGVAVGDDRIAVLCREPMARKVLVDRLVPSGSAFRLPAHALSAVSIAESHLVTWLAGTTQLRREPDEVEHRCVLPAHREWGIGDVHVFAFRVNAPHWLAERDWVVGAVGPFDPSAQLAMSVAHGFAAHSLYEPEASMGHAEHLVAITQALHGERRDP